MLKGIFCGLVSLMALFSVGVAQHGNDIRKLSACLLWYRCTEHSGFIRVTNDTPNVLRWKESKSGHGEVQLVLPFDYIGGVTPVSESSLYLVAGATPSKGQAQIVLVKLERTESPKIAIVQSESYMGAQFFDPYLICFNSNDNTIYLLTRKGGLSFASWVPGKQLPQAIKDTGLMPGIILSEPNVVNITMDVPFNGGRGVMVSAHSARAIHCYLDNNKWVPKWNDVHEEGQKWFLKGGADNSGIGVLKVSGGNGTFSIIDSQKNIIGSGIVPPGVDVVDFLPSKLLVPGKQYQIVGEANTTASGWFRITQRYGIPVYPSGYRLTKGIIKHSGFSVGSKDGAVAFRLEKATQPAQDQIYNANLWFNICRPDITRGDLVQIINPKAPENEWLTLLTNPKLAGKSEITLKAGRLSVGGGHFLEIPNGDFLIGCKVFFQFIILDQDKNVLCTDVFGTTVFGLTGQNVENAKPEIEKAWEAIKSTKWFLENNGIPENVTKEYNGILAAFMDRFGG